MNYFWFARTWENFPEFPSKQMNYTDTEFDALQIPTGHSPIGRGENGGSSGREKQTGAETTRCKEEEGSTPNQVIALVNEFSQSSYFYLPSLCFVTDTWKKSLLPIGHLSVRSCVNDTQLIACSSKTPPSCRFLPRRSIIPSIRIVK